MNNLRINKFAMAANILSGMGLGIQEPIQIHEPDGAFKNGRVLAFNAGLFEGANPDEFLTGYAVRYRDPYEDSLDGLRQFIAPDIFSGGSQLVQYPLYDFNDAMKSLDNLNDDMRGIGQDWNTLRNPTKNMVTQKIPNRGLAVEVDEDEEKLDPDWQQRKVAFLLGILNRNRLRRAVALGVAGAVTIGKVWTSASAADPDMDVLTELDNQSLRSSRLVYGPGSWSLRNRTNRGQLTAGTITSAPFKLDELAGYFAVEEVKVVRARYGIGGGSTTPIVGQFVLMCIAADNLGKDDMSNLKNFWAPTKAGAKYATYVRQVGDKRWRIGVECYDIVVLASVIGLEVINITTS